MSWSTVLFSFVLILPAIGLIAIPVSSRLQAPLVGLAVSVLRLITLAVMFHYLAGVDRMYRLDVPLASNFGMDGLFEADLKRLLFIAVCEMAYLFSHYFVSPANSGTGERKVTSVLALAQQLLLPIFIFSSNLFLFTTVQLMFVTMCFYGLRWVGHKKDDAEVAQAADTMLFRYALLGFLLLAWGLAELGFKNLSLSLSEPNFVAGQSNLAWIWLACFATSLPILPWSRWYGILFQRGVDAISILSVLAVTAVVFKLVETGSLTYKDLTGAQDYIIYALGLLGALWSISEFFASDSIRSYLVALSRFFFSMTAFSLGLSHTGSPAGAMLIAAFVPGYMVLALFISSAINLAQFRNVVLIGFLAFLFGIPGSPVYFLYGFIGAKSFSAGLSLSVIFGLVWFLYFFSVVHLSKIIFPPLIPAAITKTGGIDARLSFAFAAFMIFGLSIVCWLFGVRA